MIQVTIGISPFCHLYLTVLKIVQISTEQLTGYFKNNKFLTDYQYGFRKSHSTTYPTLNMFDKIFDGKSKDTTPALIFLDIIKAFDTYRKT